ncbi:hypothetical protein GGX14DRAFT_516803 [Mycena pura]|uniref:Uncharacterized protein n=1 Tax=Mycena pura TaxID=153505 RepID=A0AAD6YK79_9AGAR|nr:hypothetical protein GGX14DRAFT_516803 [Mycena pura]
MCPPTRPRTACHRTSGARRAGEVQWRTCSGPAEARELIGDGSLAALEQIVDEATDIVSDIFKSVLEQDGSAPSTTAVVALRLSPTLEAWRAAQLAAGRVLPAKGNGLQRVSDGVLARLGAGAWPAPLLTGGALFGSGWANMLTGAHDARTLFSNYVVDIGFYLEHGYARAFPSFESLLRDAGMRHPHALGTHGGRERRAAAVVGMHYIRAKCALEARAVADQQRHQQQQQQQCGGVCGSTARFASRRAMQVVCAAECNMLGILAEAVARGFDPAAVLADMVFSSPGTDVVDVGSDLHNSELFNAFLNAGDITNPGVVDEAALGRVYDAFAHVGARSVGGHRWAELTAAVTAQLYVWHMLDGRHMFLRRCVLGHAKMRAEGRRRRAGEAGQREADFDEAFDERFCTTGVSRPLATACDGAEPACDRLEHFLALSPDRTYLGALWTLLVTEPLAYVRGETADSAREEDLYERLACALAETYARGLVRELAWLTAHAAHHAWQVNYLNEAAMWGSFLDDGGLKGRLDRFDGEKDGE